jgi:hypothetical protein
MQPRQLIAIHFAPRAALSKQLRPLQAGALERSGPESLHLLPEEERHARFIQGVLLRKVEEGGKTADEFPLGLVIARREQGVEIVFPEVENE